MPNNLTDPPDHRRCTATARRTGSRCKRAAVAGATICISHGAAAPQVRRAASQRVALHHAAQLLRTDVAADPAEVLVAAVRASAALLGAAEAAVKADDADVDTLHQLGQAAMLAGRLARLALDAGIEQQLALQAERAGELVGSLLKRTVNALELGPDRAAAAFRHLRNELEALDAADGDALHQLGRLTTTELDTEIAKVVEQLDALDRADALAGFPQRLAGALDAALAALELTDDARERAVRAAEQWLTQDAAERANRPRVARVEAPRPLPWWATPPGKTRSSNGNGRVRR
jgi:hypothetical protein